MKIHTKKMLSYLAVGIILSQGFSLASSSFDDSTEQDTSTEVSQEIISDEVDLMAAPKEEVVVEEVSQEEEIISDEAGLEELVEEEYTSPITISSEADSMALEISNQELLRLFIENKGRLKGTGAAEVDYDDFVDAWKEMTTDYGKKSETQKLVQKQVFIEIYLRLTGGTK